MNERLGSDGPEASTRPLRSGGLRALLIIAAAVALSIAPIAVSVVAMVDSGPLDRLGHHDLPGLGFLNAAVMLGPIAMAVRGLAAEPEAVPVQKR